MLRQENRRDEKNGTAHTARNQRRRMGDSSQHAKEQNDDGVEKEVISWADDVLISGRHIDLRRDV